MTDCEAHGHCYCKTKWVNSKIHKECCMCGHRLQIHQTGTGNDDPLTSPPYRIGSDGAKGYQGDSFSWNNLNDAAGTATKVNGWSGIIHVTSGGSSDA